MPVVAFQEIRFLVYLSIDSLRKEERERECVCVREVERERER